MQAIELVWEFLGRFFGGLMRAFERGITSVFGSSNARMIKRYQSKVDAINALEPKFRELTDGQLKELTAQFRQRLADGEALDDLLVEVFAAVRESGRRFLNMRHYDVQLIGGMVLHGGNVAEMVTGEGKTLVATLPAYLNALEGSGVHVVTVNDYLARRDMEWMGPLYMGLGMTVGAIQSDMPVAERQQAYNCDITYGTNNEFGFDYLRDNMRPAARGDIRYPARLQQSQRGLAYAIIDEVDNILIDEARTPLIISGPAHQDIGRYQDADRIARQLQKERHFTVNEKDHAATLTDEGVREAERLAGVESFYTTGNMDWPHLIDNALKAHFLYKRDVNYVVKDGRVVIVDEFTGRLMEGRQWSDGLHQAVEAKEGVKIKEETQTLATITLQNYFKLYKKICGMTGTAMTEATEFWKIYKLDVVAIPTNRPLQRQEFPDTIFSSEKFKWRAVAEEIENFHRWDTVTLKSGGVIAGTIKQQSDTEIVIADKDDGELHRLSPSQVARVQPRGRPVLVGTVSIEKSELLSDMLSRRGIKHEVLNAKHHQREAEIIAQAGRKGAVTIATNMAGRGTDIILGGNPETMAWAQLQGKYPTRLDVPREEWDQLVHEIDERYQMKAEGEVVKRIGGLHVIGTERHDARRIDLQLRGRCGRQGDPGSSRFYLSLDDDLMRIFAGPFVKRVLEMGGFKDDVPMESGMVSRRIDSAQKKREEFNFEIRKNLLEYDEVMDEQRKRVYAFRQRILDGVSCRSIMLEMIEKQVDENLTTFLDPLFGPDSFARLAGGQLSTPLEGRQFRGVDFDVAVSVAHDEAQRAAEADIIAAIDENLPAGAEDNPEDWNWDALAKFANFRWKLNVRDRDLKKIGRDRVDEYLVGLAREAIAKVDLRNGAEMLAEDYNRQVASRWIKAKFNIDVTPEEMHNVELAAAKRMVVERAIKKYDEKEAEYPIMAAMYRFGDSTAGKTRLDREALIAWAANRFHVDLSRDDLKNKQRDEVREILVHHSQQHQQHAAEVMQALRERITTHQSNGQPARDGNGLALGRWLHEHVSPDLPLDGIENLPPDALDTRLTSLVADHFHPEMRRMERLVLLDVVDSAWKDHLLAMDYLLAACRQRGMAALDPKVEYKREGMRLFEGLWRAIAERVTDLIFRIEQLNEDFVSHTMVETQAVHSQDAESSEMMRRQQETQQSADAAGVPRVNTIRNRTGKVGRNDPCVCGSGKKFKHCCMRKLGDEAA
jgi:preprotein translocase subunit SecA